MKTIIVATSEEEGESRLIKALDEGYQDIDMKYLTSWKNTGLIRHLSDEKMTTIIDNLCGDKIFQGRADHATEYATNLIKNSLSRSLSSYYTDIRPGNILTENPTYNECVDRIYRDLVQDRKFFRRQKQYVDIIDDWALSSGKRKCSIDVVPKDTPRFISKPVSENDFLHKQANQCEGVLTEGFVVAHLNNHGCCPECGVSKSIGWCESSEKKTNSFRDAICMNCYDMGIITLFEIKSRWENAIAGKNTTYAGDYIALNALIGMNANIYMVIASRDTGIVRLGKVTFAFMKANDRFLYSVQEKLGWGSPNTTVKCQYGLVEMEHVMTPLINILTNEYCEKVGNDALMRLDKME